MNLLYDIIFRCSNLFAPLAPDSLHWDGMLVRHLLYVWIGNDMGMLQAVNASYLTSIC